MWPAVKDKVKPSSVQVRALIDQRDASFLPSAEPENRFSTSIISSSQLHVVLCVCIWTRMRGLAGVIYCAHVQLSSLYALRHARDFAYQALPLFLRATLKRWEWPGDKAIYTWF